MFSVMLVISFRIIANSSAILHKSSNHEDFEPITKPRDQSSDEICSIETFSLFVSGKPTNMLEREALLALAEH
jgi:hypothetical protein